MLEAVEPLAFVAVAVLPLVNAVALSLALTPLADIRIAEKAAPDSVALLQAVLPFTIINLAICPGVNAFAMSLACLEVTFISVGVGVALVAAALSQVKVPLALVNSVLLVEHYTVAFPLTLLQLASVDRVLVLFYTEILRALQLRVVKYRAFH